MENRISQRGTHFKPYPLASIMCWYGADYSRSGMVKSIMVVEIFDFLILHTFYKKANFSRNQHY
jgi:hypothetical protein